MTRGLFVTVTVLALMLPLVPRRGQTQELAGTVLGSSTAVPDEYPRSANGIRTCRTESVYFADVTGADEDGKHRADAIVVTTDHVFVRRSEGGRFSPIYERWTDGPRGDDLKTFFADVSADGKADEISIGGGRANVKLSDGKRFLADQIWADDFPTNADEKTFFADVNADGRADGIWFQNNRVNVRLSDGNGFLSNQVWADNFPTEDGGTPFCADVNGDGRADPILLNDAGVNVRLSTGDGKIGDNRVWIDNSATEGSKKTFFADANGDGKADAIFVGPNDINVGLSYGDGFLANEMRTENIPTDGGAGMLFVDVTGDARADAISVKNDDFFVRVASGNPNVIASVYFGGNESWTEKSRLGKPNEWVISASSGKMGALKPSQTMLLDGLYECLPVNFGFSWGNYSFILCPHDWELSRQGYLDGYVNDKKADGFCVMGIMTWRGWWDQILYRDYTERACPYRTPTGSRHFRFMIPWGARRWEPELVQVR